MALDVLLSYAFHSTLELRKVRAAMPPDSLLMVDSGAYTAWTTGKQVGVGEYGRWLQDNAGGWDWAVTLDAIGDWRASGANTRALHLAGHPVLPVYHYGSPYPEFLAMCREAAVEGGYVCAGGMKPLAKNQGVMARYLLRLALDAREHGVAVHALGVGSAKTIRSAQVASTDSSTVSRGPLNGTVTLWDGGKLRPVRLDDPAGLLALSRAATRYHLPLATAMRAGRWSPEVRIAAFAAGLLSMAEFWASERTRHPVLGPPGSTGPRYFNSMTTTEGVAAVLRASAIQPTWAP